ncbi:MAG TPA: alpha-2-macroglobulin family protein [Candidatus Contendobacter sp.]|nr:alpha-2-macroglobulin family protein [Candidatus Contendobacter sp.]HRD49306.1 alpha-2-macroglobulin family protein [Candidatus Contendobacter sp.]
MKLSTQKTDLTLRLALSLLLVCLGSLANPVTAWAAPPQFDRLERPAGAIMAPERFLRPWDAVTLFFDQDQGPAAGGVEDEPQRVARMEPAWAGEWRWLNGRTLQFRPAEPWPPLARVTVDINGQRKQLLALLPAPVRSAPAHATENLPQFDRVTLTFPTPVDPAALARLLTLEVRPLPAVGSEGLRVLNARDFEIKVGERADRSAEANYVVVLRDPVPGNHQIDLKLRLSDEPSLNDELKTLSFRTAEPFRLKNLQCGQVGEPDYMHRDIYVTDKQVKDFIYCKRGSGYEHAQNAAPALVLGFNHDLAKPDGADRALSPLVVRNLLHFTPAVEALKATVSGSYLIISGRFASDRIYTLRLAPADLRDRHDNPLVLKGDETFRLALAPEPPSLQWDAAQGVVERLGPQMAPLRGRGFSRVDLRIHAIDPFSRDFWPFPDQPVRVDDDQEPPLPGVEPQPHQQGRDIAVEEIAKRLKTLGSPAFSEVIPLPLLKGGALAKFGLDLKPPLTRIAGSERPGAYMAGLRPLDSSSQRAWMRIQVTDLALTAVEEREHVHFFVTSLATTQPVPGAEIQLDGVDIEGRWCKTQRGVTDAQGHFDWQAPGPFRCSLRRVSVQKGEDVLILDPNRPLPRYARERWSVPGGKEDGHWLNWTTADLNERRESPRLLCHLFTERPIYRPEDPVQIKGMVRDYWRGQLRFGRGGGTLVVRGPNDQEWRYPVKLDEYGGFYHRFGEETPATGDYRIHFEIGTGSGAATPPAVAHPEEESDSAEETTADAEASADADEEASDEAINNTSCGEVTFKKEAYRLPTFEVLLNVPQRVSLEREFSVQLTARYFAGGLVADRPVQWRVAQFPYAWTPPRREGFFFSSDARFSSDKDWRATPTLQRPGQTDGEGGATLTLDPTAEPTAQPRRYLIEATVTGPDEMQARATLPVVALPPFALGVKVPRYFTDADAVEPEILVADPEGKPLPGRAVTVRLIKRNWNSILQASDFAQGAAKYVTEVIDETLSETVLTSADEVQKLHLPLRDAGVYLLQLEAADRLGRAQKVSVDFFVEGKTPVTWSQPPAQIVTVTADKDAYNPGETAILMVQSPFQTARALAVVEEPEGPFRYQWVDIANGYGRFPLAVRKQHLPKVPVHFLLMRGRLPDAVLAPTAPFDLGKPVTLAATRWITVNPVKNTLAVKLDAPAKARPGDDIEVTLKLADDEGQPVAGEATFWMVDQALFALAREQPLDPLPHFIAARRSRLVAHDSRSLAFGILPLKETPGGDGEKENGDDWGLDNMSVRKNFTPAPVFLPKVSVGADGLARIKVKLPDSLTVFKLRAKAISGPDRFGYATGEIQVRQPVLAQPVLPRFVRPGDQFSAGLIGRVVEGPGGEGKAAVKLDGLRLEGASEQRFAWADKKPQNLDFTLTVPDPGLRMDGGLQRERVRVLFTLERLADQSRDAVEVGLPMQPDRRPIRRAQLKEVAPGATLELPLPPEPIRPGTFRRVLTVSTDPGLARLIAGLDTLLAFPYGCTEQRLSQAWVLLALRNWSGLLPDGDSVAKRASAAVQAVAQIIAESIDDQGLVAFWPKSRGYVALTAWSLAFLAEAKKQGEPVDDKLLERLTRVLRQALRSDYPRLLSGSEYLERTTALEALASAGAADEAYLTELLRQAAFLTPEAAARVAVALAQSPSSDRPALTRLVAQLWEAVETRRFQGRDVYAGLRDGNGGSPLILPSETRTLATILHAVALTDPHEPRLNLLTDALIRLGQQDGWGSTQADQQAIRALFAYQTNPAPAAGRFTLRAGPDGKPEVVAVERFIRRSHDAATPWLIVADPASAPLVVNENVSYLPAAAGSAAKAETAGFVVNRDSFRVPAQPDLPLERLAPAGEGQTIELKVGQVVEDRIEVVNPELRHHVIIEAPLAAGMEPLNSRLANAATEASPSQPDTAAASYQARLDDRRVYVFDELPAGNYRFFTRSRATIPGRFTQPPSTAEMMYRRAVNGSSAGARIIISR